MKNKIEQVVQIKLENLRPDKANRKIGGFDQAKLESLAESIKAVGVQQPAVVRMVPRYETDYEIVAGERRWRAAKLAGLKTLPCVVRDLDDVTVLKIRTIENLQREDVHPLDEADGYARLLNRAAYDVEHLAAEVGKSTTYVYQRLKLCDLVPWARNMLVKDEITPGHAILIARLQPDQQAEIIESNFFKQRYDGMPSVRELDEHIRSSVMMDLSRVSFKKNDADLIPTAGSCETCKKRSGSQTALFADVCKKDYCLDPVCFNAKLDAMVKRQNEKLSGSQYLVVREGYADDKKLPRESIKKYDWDECKAKDADAVRCLVVDGPGRGRLTWGKKRESHRYEQSPQEKAAAEKKKRELRIKTEVRKILYKRVIGDLQIDDANLSRVVLWRVLVSYAWERLENNNQTVLAKLEQWDKPVKKLNDYSNGIEKQGQAVIKNLNLEGLILFMAKIATVRELNISEYYSQEPTNLYSIANMLSLNAKTIEAEAKKDLHDEVNARAVKKAKKVKL